MLGLGLRLDLGLALEHPTERREMSQQLHAPAFDVIHLGV
jgi:hypothetical protein